MESAIAERILEVFFLELERGSEDDRLLARELRTLHRDQRLHDEKTVMQRLQQLALEPR